ncbi:TetR/AcrR family transcriptional regulator [Streptomyces sp. NBC_00258]|uniref:TetR/AcrR family transcriptional regulator n=1 Tax=Streptomyces sp. NBC_00258 TaxID=2903642 RepID=UPI002E2B2C29|nr:TetR/AcrR family transcriptional regulator [Streptomyces sp. NBC_00258]
MPTEVESTERRRQIGKAALRVVRERGAAQLTIRAVADAMGGSTSLVTHYVRNRRELLILAFTAVEHRWAAEENRLAQLPAADRIDYLAQWGANWSSEEDEVLAALLLHLLTEARPAPESLAVVHQELDAWRQALGEAAEAADIRSPWASADLIYLVSRGAMLSTLEHPDAWTAERLAAAARNLNRLLRPAHPSSSGRA